MRINAKEKTPFEEFNKSVGLFVYAYPGLSWQQWFGGFGYQINFSGMYSNTNGTVMTVKFKILKDSGTSNLILTSTENIDSDGNGYACSVMTGVGTIVGSSSVLGDVNGDGNVTAIDARLVLKHSVGETTLSESQQNLADMNCDGKISAIDARIILRKSVS